MIDYFFIAGIQQHIAVAGKQVGYGSPEVTCPNNTNRPGVR
jgi:hypothetical protein